MRISIACLTASLLIAATLPAADKSQSAGNLYRHGDYTAAVNILRQAPQDAANLELLGQCYFMLGDFKKSTEVLEKASILAPADSMTQTWLGRAWGRRAERAFPLMAIGYATKAREAFERAVRTDPGNTEALGDLFDFYLEAPKILGGGLNKAEAMLPDYEKHDPLGYYIATAKIAETKQDFATAERNLRHAVELAPRRLSVVLALAQFLERRGRHEDAAKIFRQATSVAPDSPRVVFARASSLIQGHRNVTQARELLIKYLAANNLTPEDPPRWEARQLLRKAEGS
ncbi:MAG: tetratricopeptide repeat protein [Acidobacteriota bacterium]|nr:tetratricopeptide repeat protein [Acidobacteriota bacterium]